MIFLSVAYAANTGGTGTLTGTGSNLVLKNVLADMGAATPINFANWMLYACPAMLLNLSVCWLWLQFWYMGCCGNPIRGVRNMFRYVRETGGEKAKIKFKS